MIANVVPKQIQDLLSQNKTIKTKLTIIIIIVIIFIIIRLTI